MTNTPDKLREILEKLYYAPKMDDVNPVGWKEVHITQAIKSIEELFIKTQKECCEKCRQIKAV